LKKQENLHNNSEVYTSRLPSSLLLRGAQCNDWLQISSVINNYLRLRVRMSLAHNQNVMSSRTQCSFCLLNSCKYCSYINIKT
jgi:hypothetical protein